MTYGDTLDRDFPLILVVGREGNNQGVVVDRLGTYNFVESNRSAFWNSTYTYFARISGLASATEAKDIVRAKNASPIVFANAAPLVIPNPTPGKEQIRARVGSDARISHAAALFAHAELTTRLAYVILSGFEGASSASAPAFRSTCKSLNINVIEVAFFYGTNLRKIQAAIPPATTRELATLFQQFVRS